MNRTNTFEISALWQGRPESPASIADRLRYFLTLSRPTLLPDMAWYGKNKSDEYFCLEKQPDEIERFVANAFSKHDDGSPYLYGGYICVCLCLVGDPRKEVITEYFSLIVGSQTQNSFSLFTDVALDDSTDSRLVTYDAIRTTMMSVVWAFEPDWCEAGPVALQRYYDIEVYNRPPMPLAWMIWLKPSLAAQIRPPHQCYQTIAEHYHDGSLFMAACKETFECESHLGRARAIHRQIDPLNYTEPFCGMSGRSDRVPPFPKL